ncbi:MAG: DUF3347 domain-containing protein [Ferruginibacter sp.]
MVKKILLFVLIVLAAYAVYWFAVKRKQARPEGPKPVPMALKKHSETFNKSIDSIVNSYLAIKNAFVENDTAGAKNATRSFIDLLNRLPMEEMKKDTAMVLATVEANVGDLKLNANSLLNQANITEMRKDFNAVTEQMYPSFFTAINYEGPKLYYVNCPMAFDGDVAANWISNSAEIINPYIGKDHPKYKSTMLNCGEVKDSIVAK